MADHGSDCEGPPMQHPVLNLEDFAFRCKNHMMTAVNDGALGRVTLTPNHMVDFTHSSGVIEFDISTFRRGGYDWLEFFITPFSDNLVHPAQPFWDSAGPPRNGIAIELVPGGINEFKLTVFKDGEAIEFPACGLDCPGNNSWIAYDTPLLPLVPSQRRRDTFRITINRDNISFGVFGYYDGQDSDNEFYFLENVPLPDLGWSRGVVQLTHSSFNPTNNCANVPDPVNPADNPPGEIICEGDTWHWDNVRIEPAVPFNIIASTRRNSSDQFKQRYVDPERTPGSNIKFAEPAPENAFLRFSAIGSDIEVSFDGGTSWSAAKVQPQLEYLDFRFNNYFHPMPVGASEVVLRGGSWWGGLWHARDFSVWAETEQFIALPERN